MGSFGISRISPRHFWVFHAVGRWPECSSGLCLERNAEACTRRERTTDATLQCRKDNVLYEPCSQYRARRRLGWEPHPSLPKPPTARHAERHRPPTGELTCFLEILS